MKQLGVVLILLVTLSFFGFKCDMPESQSVVDESVRDGVVCTFFKGNHVIQRLVPVEKTESHSSFGGFFLFGTGGVSGSASTSSSTVITFAWQTNTDSSFVFSTIPLSKVRVKIVETIEEPTVAFSVLDPSRWPYSPNKYILYEGVKGWNTLQPDEILQYVMSHAVISTPSKYWPKKIELP